MKDGTYEEGRMLARFFLIVQTVLRIRSWDPVPFLTLDPGSGIGFLRIPDPKPNYF
jgi:hypothetical protein